jgi:hypothetical protein
MEVGYGGIFDFYASEKGVGFLASTPSADLYVINLKILVRLNKPQYAGLFCSWYGPS